MDSNKNLERQKQLFSSHAQLVHFLADLMGAREDGFKLANIAQHYAVPSNRFSSQHTSKSSYRDSFELNLGYIPSQHELVFRKQPHVAAVSGFWNKYQQSRVIRFACAKLWFLRLCLWLFFTKFTFRYSSALQFTRLKNHYFLELAFICVTTLFLAEAAPLPITENVNFDSSFSSTGMLATFTPTYTQASALSFHTAKNTRILIMINGNCDIARRVGPSITQTWMTLPGHNFVTVRFIVGDSGSREDACSGDEALERSFMVYLPQCSDSYPPVEKVLCMWDFARSTWLSSFHFFLKIDADTYINIPNLLTLLAQHAPSEHLFAGAVGTGRNHDLPPYCLGPAYILSQYTLSKIPSDFIEISPRLENSDTTLSSVVRDFTQITCMDGIRPQYRWSFMNRYWDFRDGQFKAVMLNELSQSILPLTHPMNSALLIAISVHPLKRPVDMRKFHRYILTSLLPLFITQQPRKEEPVPPQLRPMCVYNPSVQYELSGFMLRECAPVRPVRPRKLKYAFIVHLKEHQQSFFRATEIAERLRSFHLQPVLFQGIEGKKMLNSFTGTRINHGEIGLRESYRLLYHTVLRRNARETTGFSSSSLKLPFAVQQKISPDPNTDSRSSLDGHPFEHDFSADELYLVLEDDVIFSPRFRHQLDLLLQDPRCGSFLSSNSGGVLLLGATIWRNGSYPQVNPYTGGWTIAELDMEQHPNTRCYNFNTGVYGTFSFILDKRAMQMVLMWLNDPQYADRPVDHAWAYLSEQGIPVRVAYPYIVIPRVDTSIIHKSGNHLDAIRRAVIHRWFFSES
eukprot:gene7330-7680_t